MLNKPIAPDYIRAIAPYQGGKPISELAREMGLNEADIIKLASNENPLGISPKAQMAIDAAVADIARYPDGNSFALRDAVSHKFGVVANQIVFGNGSNDILELVARAYLQAGDEAIYSQHAFAVYPLVTQAMGAKGIVVPAKDYAHDLDGFLKAITPKTKLIFIANPNNPTGTLLKKDTLRAFIQAVPSHVLIMLDEAYDEYLNVESKSEAIDWLAGFENLIISRTFSKAYGLAGLRIGFGLTHANVADMLNRVRQPFNVNSIAQAAAIASLADEDFVARSYAANQAGMLQITQGLQQLGLSYIPSQANFVSFAVKDAAQVNKKLLQSGVILRPIANYEMPDYLRVSVGLFSENARFLDVLKKYFKHMNTHQKLATDDVRIREIKTLIPPSQLLETLQESAEVTQNILETRTAIHRILHQQDDRMLVIVGPCSIHDTKAGLEYAGRLLKVHKELTKDLLIVMRVYFEKPRTTVGWKGLINDPHLDGSYDINEGLARARKFLLDVNALGMPAGMEFLDTITPQYTADLVSWGAIGARTTESQVHRELASGLSCPVGFKNGTDGGVQVAIDAIRTAKTPHHFLSVTKEGHSAIISTTGNEDCHVILRGGKVPNYDAKSVAAACDKLTTAYLTPNLMVDCSHANSQKDYTLQKNVAADIAAQLSAGEARIMGVMLESHLNEGRQDHAPGCDLEYGKSITDACLGWDDTVEVLNMLALSVRSRRLKILPIE